MVVCPICQHDHREDGRDLEAAIESYRASVVTEDEMRHRIVWGNGPDWEADRQAATLSEKIAAWTEVAEAALDREGATDWDDTHRIAEAVVSKLWNYLSDGLLPTPKA